MKLFCFFNFICFITFGQDLSRKNIYQSANIFYGPKLMSGVELGGEINNLNNYSFDRPINYIGASIIGNPHVIPYVGHHNGCVYYSQVVPQKININDSVNAFISGYNLGFTIYGIDLLRKFKKIDLIVDVGGNIGRLRFFGNSLANQKNPYFAPKVSFIPRVILGKICLQLQFEYDYDVSKRNWKRTYFSNSPKIDLPKTNSSGLNCFLSLGFLFDN